MPASTSICARIPTTGAGCPSRIVWSDLDWAARAERLLFDIEEAAPAEEEAAPVAHVASDASDTLTAVAS